MNHADEMRRIVETFVSEVTELAKRQALEAAAETLATKRKPGRPRKAIRF